MSSSFDGFNNTISCSKGQDILYNKFMPQKAKFELPDQEELTKKIGKNIAFFRKKNGFTQNELAKAIGISQKLLSHYETGRLRITSEMLYHIAKGLSISADKLLGLEKIENKNQNISFKLIRRLKILETLPESQQKTILRSLDMMVNSAKK